MRLVLIALILNFGTAVGAEEIRGSEAEQILLIVKILYAANSSEGGQIHNFTIAYRKKICLRKTKISLDQYASQRDKWNFCIPYPK